jgi:hypothetical protein
MTSNSVLQAFLNPSASGETQLIIYVANRFFHRCLKKAEASLPPIANHLEQIDSNKKEKEKRRRCSTTQQTPLTNLHSEVDYICHYLKKTKALSHCSKSARANRVKYILKSKTEYCIVTLLWRQFYTETEKSTVILYIKLHKIMESEMRGKRIKK